MRIKFAFLVVLGVLFILAVFVFYFRGQDKIPQVGSNNFVTQVPLSTPTGTASVTILPDTPVVSVVAEGLDTPWAMAFLPRGGALITERKGTVRLITAAGELLTSPIGQIIVREVGESGLHGIALHPDFNENSLVYLYYTYEESGSNSLNRVARFTFDGARLSNEEIIVDKIPGAPNHDGGRIKFGPDKLLYITTGDAQEPSLAQDKNSLAGKVLRVTEGGTPAPGNPFGNRVYSLGHRNPQGIVWDNNGTLWETEHGPSGAESGNDEFNKIEPGKNYGWPDIRGRETKAGMVVPILESGRSDTWAPAALAYINGKFYFAGLRGSALYEVSEVTSANPKFRVLFKGEYGRLREVIAGPDGMLYVTTSNRDGRGIPKVGDDKVLRINPAKL